MLLLILCGIFILIIFVLFFSIFANRNQQTEYFSNDKQEPVSKILEKTKKEINNNKDN